MSNTKKMTVSGLCLALCLLLPFLTGQIQKIGNMLCPMHLPVLLCGMICGWPWGLAVGAVAPLLRSVLWGMPPMLVAIAMAFELAAYGLVTGLIFPRTKQDLKGIYIALVIAMTAGRLVWGAVRFVMAGLSGSAFPMSAFLSGAVLTAWPGIVLQLILVPAMIRALQKSGQLN